MEKDLHDEIMGKAYDSRLMKRLLKYARPYWKHLLLALILLVSLTGLELLNPYILKVAIDDYLNGNEKPMYELSLDSPYDGLELGGYKYVRARDIEDEDIDKLSQAPLKRIMKEEGAYYIVDYEAEGVDGGFLLSQNDYERFRKQDISGINRLSIFYLLVILLTFLFNYFQVLILNYTAQKIIFNMREEIFNHIKSLAVSYFDKNPIGRLVTRVTNDTETLNEMYSNVLVTLVKDVLMLLGIMAIMLRLNYKLALASFALLPLIIVSAYRFRNSVRKVYRLGRIQLAKINASLNENITGMRTIQIFNKEKKLARDFDEINNDYLQTSLKEVSIYANFRPFVEVIRYLGITIIIYFGGGKVISNQIEFGVLYLFIDYIQKFFAPILDLTEKYNILQSSMASSERIFGILDDKTMIENSEDTVDLKGIKGKIEFKNVWFAYDDENWVLKDVSFTINPGETVALVGATGAGKSSIINLITRFYDIQKGEILLDGVNIKDIDKFKLRRLIGVVLQDVFLFTGTIRDNITLNNKSMSQKEVEEVASYVNANYFIDRLPKKYDEPVMERGSTLSSGERQLLSFARTLAYDPRILILDEATSNIDTETELLIQDALGKLIKGRTSIVIAHRLSTIQHADKIIVLSKGVIKEMGNHQELLEMEGIYYDLYKLQYGD
ncbi:MAG: ABC transporter transmembrane domain-containing protein [Tissierellaceae bacterium]|jgi:ATP-binding cassette subfamily B multidrug efflux pump